MPHALVEWRGRAWLFTPGCQPLERDGARVWSGGVQRRQRGSADLRDEVFLAFANLERVLASADYGLRDVVKFCTYLVDRNDVLAFQEACAEVLLASHDGLAPLPASTLVVVSSLADPLWRVEIDAVAVRRR